MKSKIVTLIIATAAVFSGVGTANANDSVNVRSNIYLSSGSEFNFKVFMNKKAKRFIKRNTNDWATFNNVVRIYNGSSGKFLNVTEEEKAEFFVAAATINQKLEKMRNREAQIWLKKVDVTQKVFDFVWSNRIKQQPSTEIFEIPTLKVEAALGR